MSINRVKGIMGRRQHCASPELKGTMIEWFGRRVASPGGTISAPLIHTGQPTLSSTRLTPPVLTTPHSSHQSYLLLVVKLPTKFLSTRPSFLQTAALSSLDNEKTRDYITSSRRKLPANVHEHVKK